MNKNTLLAFSLISLSVFAEEINGVKLESTKKDGLRTYHASISRTILHSLELVKRGIFNFEEKCNNDYKDRRKFTDKSADCKYHNDHLIETFAIRELKKDSPAKGPNETDRFLLGRRIYNRGAFAHYELIQVFESKNAKNQREIKMIQTMLEDKEVGAYAVPAFEKESAFKKAVATYRLTELSPKEVLFDYEYLTDTDHWLLNKEVSVSQVNGAISKSINDLLESILKEAALVK